MFPCHGMAELPRILFGHERGNLRSTRLALIEWLYAISAFKMSSYYLIKVCGSFFFFFLLIWKIRFLSRCLLMHDLRGNYILFLNKPGITTYGLNSLFSYVSAKLRNALPDFIRTYEFTGFRIQGRILYSGFSF